MKQNILPIYLGPSSWVTYKYRNLFISLVARIMLPEQEGSWS